MTAMAAVQVPVRSDGVVRLDTGSLAKAIVHAALLGTFWRDLTGSETIVEIGSYAVSIAEPMLALLLLTLALQLGQRGLLRSPLLVLGLALSASFGVSLMRGAAIDPAAAFFEGRLYSALPLMIVLASSLTLREERVLELVDLLIRYALLLSVLVLARRFLGILWTSGALSDGRPILAAGSLVVSLALPALLIWKERFGRPWIWRTAFAILLAAQLVSGQGTNLIASVAALGFVWTFSHSRRFPLGIKAILAVLVGACVLLLASNWQAIVAGDPTLSAWLSERQGTNETRRMVWSALLDRYDARSSFEQAFGRPFGTAENLRLRWKVGTIVTWRNSLHSAYFQTLSASGAVGVAILLAVLLWLFARSVQQVIGSGLSDRLALTAGVHTFVLAIYGYSYDYRTDTGLGLFLAATICTQIATRRFRAESRRSRGNGSAPNGAVQ